MQKLNGAMKFLNTIHQGIRIDFKIIKVEEESLASLKFKARLKAELKAELKEELRMELKKESEI